MLPTLGYRALTAAPNLWNKLPISLRNQQNCQYLQKFAQAHLNMYNMENALYKYIIGNIICLTTSVSPTLDVISALLQHDIYIGDALLLAVEVQFVGAVRVLCRFCEKEQVKVRSTS